MLAQNSDLDKGYFCPPRTLMLFLLFIASAAILLTLITFKADKSVVTKTGPKQIPITKGELYERVIDLTYQLPADPKNPMRIKPQVITTKEAARTVAEQIAKQLKENPKLSAEQIASLSAGKLPLSFYSAKPASSSIQLPGDVTVSLLREGIIRITQLLQR